MNGGDDVPEGWTRTTLGELGEYSNGRGFKKAEWSDAGRMIIRIQDLTGTGDRPHYFVGDVDDRHVVRRGDILVSWAATLDAFIWRGPEAVLNQHIFRCRSRIDPTFHFYLLKSAMEQLRTRTHGSGMVHITKKQFDSLPVNLPPADAQRKIAEAIDEQLSRLMAARGAIERLKRRLRLYRQSLLDRAFSLARDSEPGNNVNGTTLVPLGLLARSSDYGTSQKAVRDGDGDPVVRIPNVVRGSLDLSDLKFLRRGVEIDESKRLRPGDFLIVRTNGSRGLIGRAALVEDELATPHHHASYLIRFRLLGTPSTWRWVRLVWGAPAIRNAIERAAASSAGQYNISLSWLDKVELPMPRVETRDRIAADTERRLSVVTEVEQQLTASLRRSEALQRALLLAAFGGGVRLPE